jgi:tetratricopeptide (TPR) repeat protein
VTLAYNSMVSTAPLSEASQILALAIESQRTGKVQEAVSLYRRSLPYLSVTEQNTSLRAAIHNNLGVALRQLGDRQGAADAFHQAVVLLPGYLNARLNLGVILLEDKEFERAIAVFNEVLELHPNCPEAHNNMGTALRHQGNLAAAENAYSAALRIRPGYVEAQMNLAIIYESQEKLDEASELLQIVLSQKPDFPEAHLNLGTVLHRQGKYESAIEAFQRAQSLRSNWAAGYINLASALKEQRRLDAAEEAASMGIQLKPKSPEAHYNLATILHDQGELAAATESYRKALSLHPYYVEALSDFGLILILQGDRSGFKHLEQALQLKPNYAAGHWNKAVAYLRLGDYAAAWPEYEWRWLWSRFASSRRTFLQPQWRGETLHGETILLHAEQGLGDTLQFVRYAPLVVERGGRVILEVQQSLRSLLSNLSGVDQIVTRGEALPEFHWHCPLMSLPLAFGTTLDTIPALCPYIMSPEKLPELNENQHSSSYLRVGVAWAGNPDHREDHLRSIPWKKLLPIMHVSRAQFISLQQGPAAEEITEMPTRLFIERNHFEDFAATAKTLATLDLIISVDTSVAHLAGAMGKPVWILLPKVADWRWLNDRNDCPWYPTARLFRQRVLGDWDEVFVRVVQELEMIIHAKHEPAYS